MAVRKINESTLTAIGNAIRAKTGGSSLIDPEDMATEIESISSGGIENGLEILDYYSTGEIKEANWHGSVSKRCLNYFGFQTQLSTVHFVDNPTHVGAYAFYQSNIDVDMETLKNVETADDYAFIFGANLATKTLSLPNFTGNSLSSASSRFRSSNAQYYSAISLPKMQHIKDYDFYQLKVTNQSIQIGSVGYPLTTCGQRPWGSATGSGTITIYTTGELLDTIKNAAQNSAGANYTFVYKASEATTYNGTSYAAGDTMLTV